MNHNFCADIFKNFFITFEDLLLSVLNASSSKREAKSYITNFRPAKKSLADKKAVGRQRAASAGVHPLATPAIYKHGVNLGGFYGPPRAVEQSPVFAHKLPLDRFLDADADSLHVALVKLREPGSLDDITLKGVGLTLCQLSQLGLPSVVLLDSDAAKVSDDVRNSRAWRQYLVEQADRVVAAIDAHPYQGARRVDGVINVLAEDGGVNPLDLDAGALQVTSTSVLLKPLRRGVIPVIAPVGYLAASQRAIPVNPNAAFLALTKELAGLSALHLVGKEGDGSVGVSQKEISLDRLIMLDPLGGIPSQDAVRGRHLFINLEQEFSGIRQELVAATGVGSNPRSSGPYSPIGTEPHPLSFGSGSSWKEKTGLHDGPASSSRSTSSNCHPSTASSASRHLSNLECLHDALAMVPPSTSGLLITPQEAAASACSTSATFHAQEVGTRRQRNTLIHNLLTDKPPYSSSLPAGRLSCALRSSTESNENVAASFPATFVKRGLPLTIIPDPSKQPWVSPTKGGPSISLHDPRIDLSRLVDLIEDSFSRKLDLKHYLSRVNDKIAGVIIAGEYEGGALLTWETPPHAADDASPSSASRPVPYLDKFAVRKRSQGAGGVADMVFTAMVRGCFPDGVCWRSRRDNPVNKWYFERARGTWKIPGTQWTMFWTNDDLPLHSQTFYDFQGVCRSIEPSWADKKHVVD